MENRVRDDGLANEERRKDVTVDLVDTPTDDQVVHHTKKNQQVHPGIN